ncbi:MAG: trypsin-like peptidase domain-containing protein [Acidobacteriota bacterium]|nr:MAG: trypsin-like peptidase domain-containing protein [Acidobacteriota bacterium]
MIGLGARGVHGAPRACALACLVVMLAFLMPPASAQVIQIADEEIETIETPHPYPPGSPPGTVVWSERLHWPGASYIAVHFSRFELAPGDRLVLHDPAGRYRHTYTGRGLRDQGGDFWGLSILGDTMLLELIATNPNEPAFGVVIDRWAHGYPHRSSDPSDEPGTDALCGTEDFRDVECYASSYPTEYDKARAAVRLIKNGSAHCTGWMASCENHIVTNEHCVGSQSELNQIEFQFDYKRPSCGSGSPTVDLQLQGGTLLELDAGLDYALIMPALAGNDPQSVYGFMQWDPRLPDIDELMYIPGHPSGDPKRLSVESTHSQDESGRCEVYSTSQPACTGGPPDIGYYCDTEGGSSGSAVLSAVSHKVIALHHCANCPNRGVPILDVYNDIQASSHPLPACVTCETTADPTDLVTSSPAENQVLLDWQPVVGAVRYHVYRSTESCAAVTTKIAETTEPTYLDEDVSGGVTYYYKVTALSECLAESGFSNCASAEPSGSCTEPPRFSGLLAATSARMASCGIELDWEPATARCGSVRYNVYRSVFTDFEPSPGNLVASCLSGTSYVDNEVLSQIDYHYIVRAEDDTGFGQGPCSSGNEDANRVEQAASATGPDIVLYSESFERGGAGWSFGGEWQIAAPQGKGGTAGGGQGHPDPMQASDGIYVLGVDISGSNAFDGNYESGISTPEIALSPVFDASGHESVWLRLQRWLGTHRAPLDQATIDIFDGNGWVTAWSNPEFPLYDNEWVGMDLDISEAAADFSGARMRFTQSSNDDNFVACSWNVDEIEVYAPTACESGTPNVPPVPDGHFAGGVAMTAEDAGGTQSGQGSVLVSWDVSSCPEEFYHLLEGDSDGLPSYTLTGGVCNLGVSGQAEVPVTDPDPGHFTWWVIVAADGLTEGVHGFDSGGGVRASSADGLCGLVEQSLAGVCP